MDFGSCNLTTLLALRAFIETCKSYPYLGSLNSNNGQFKLNISKLCKSASRAMYTLSGNVNKFSSRNVTILLDLFGKSPYLHLQL